MPVSSDFRPSIAHATLGGEFFDEVQPANFPQQILRYRNQRWAQRVGLGELTDAEWLEHFSRFAALPGSLPVPLALRYHGHQFRVYNPDLGDGRGFLYAQLKDPQDGRLLDLATKGSGRTPWSRTADGRLTLKGGVREILATEMLEALGVDTSKTFSLVETGEELTRGDEPSPTRSSVMVRLSHSHIRIGSFQRLLYLDELSNIRKLLDYTIRTYMPHLWREAPEERALAFLGEVRDRVAATGAAWMLAGFVHGVLNTDNINVTGESFDYGPWRFLPELDPAFTAAYFDQTGLYAYGRQPDTLAWNLTRLAECLLPIADKSKLEDILRGFEPAFHTAFNAAVLRRLGLAPAGEEAELALVRSVWKFLIDTKMPFEQFFFDWHGGRASESRAAQSPSAQFYAQENFEPVFAAIAAHQAAPAIRLDHAYFKRATPCTMLIEEVEALWEPIAASDDWAPLHAKLEDIAAMREAYHG